MKYDIVIGNPPYQENTNSTKGNQQGGYWYKFIDKVLKEYSPQIGVFVTPTSMFSTGGFGTKKHKVSSIINKGYGFTNITNATNRFKVGIDITSYTIVKGYNGITKTSGGDIQITLNYPIPYIISTTNSSIVEKTYKHGGGWPFTEVFKGNEDDWQIRTNGGRFKKWNRTTIGRGSQFNKGQGIVIDEEDVPAYESLFKSKLFKYLFVILGGESGQSATGILKALLNPGVEKVWTSNALYEYFNLSKEEISLIESSI